MRVVSLFSGVDGLALGLEWAGVGEVVAHVESEPYCQEVLRERFPDALGLADVRLAGAHNLPDCDVLCGGYPCQGNSVAGKRLGHDDPRSGLWREFARIIGELRPRYIVVENVPGVAQPIRDRDTGEIVRCAPIWDVLGDLAAAGYDAVGIPLSVADCGGPHLRERAFVLAWLADTSSDGCHRGSGPGGVDARLAAPNRDPLPVAALNGRRPRGPGRRAASGTGEQQQALPVTDARSQRKRRLQPEQRTERGEEAESWGCGEGHVTDADRERHDGRGSCGTGRGEPANGGSKPPPPNSIGSGLEGRGLPGGECPDERPARASGDTHGERARGITQPGVVRGIHGLSAWLDHGWTQSVYAPQHDWEAPRLSPKGPFTNERIKALGNSVSPVVAYVIGLILMDLDAHLRGS